MLFEKSDRKKSLLLIKFRSVLSVIIFYLFLKKDLQIFKHMVIFALEYWSSRARSATLNLDLRLNIKEVKVFFNHP